MLLDDAYHSLRLLVQEFAVSTIQQQPGTEHPDTLDSMSNPASTCRNQGRRDEAEALFVQVVETRKTVLGADHPGALASMANLEIQRAAPSFTVTFADEIPIEIVVTTPYGSRSHKISNLDDPGIGNRFAAITHAKRSLAFEYHPLDPHKCFIEYISGDEHVLLPCNGEEPFENHLREYKQRGGRNLRMNVQYRDHPGTRQLKTVQQEAERLLKEKRSENFNKKLCLLETVLLSTLFGNGNNIFSRLSTEDSTIFQRLQKDWNLAYEIRDKGKKLLALMILAKAEPLGETFFDFWDDGIRDTNMPLSYRERPCFCDDGLWERMRLYEDQLLVAELKSLKEKPWLHDFWEVQPLPLAEKEKINGGGFAEIFKVRLIKDHPELYGIYRVCNSELLTCFGPQYTNSSSAGR